MNILFRIIFIVSWAFFVFYFLGGYETHAPKGQIVTTSKISPLINSASGVCFRDPSIQFFMYHYVRDHDPHDTATTKELSVAPSLFEEHMKKVESLAKTGAITLMHGDTFISSLKSGCFPGKNIWIFTADDGWIDMKDSLVPIATLHHIPFFLGIITDRLDTHGFIQTTDLKEFSKNPLISISSHSIHHLDNSILSEADETREMCDSRKKLQELTKQSIDTYIYPSGRVNSLLDIKIAEKCGYALAWSTRYGTDYNDHTGSVYDLNRIRISTNTPPEFFDRYIKKLPKN